MSRHIFQWSAWVFLAVGTCWASAADQSALRAYPDPLPTDTSFDTVVKSQAFPLMKYPVTIIGAKVHPEEVHVTPSGELIFPYTEMWKGLCVAPLLGTRPSGGNAGPAALSLPPVEALTWRLVDGCLPGVENQWKMGDIELRQLAFATEGGKFESITAKEPLIALVRYTITNKSTSPCAAELAIQFGQAFGGLSMKAVPPVYPQELSFDAPLLKQKDGATVARLLSKNPAAAFKPLGPQTTADPAHYVLVNEKEEINKGPAYAVEVERQGDAVTVGPWTAPAGADFYVESSKGHSSSFIVDLKVVGPDGAEKSIGWLDRKRFSSDAPAGIVFIAPGEHSAALPWKALANSLPQGKSKIVARCSIPSGDKLEACTSWEPIVLFARPGVTPKFKNPWPRYSDENRLTVSLSLQPGESKTVDLAVPYFPLSGEAAQQLDSLSIDDELAAFRDFGPANWIATPNSSCRRNASATPIARALPTTCC